MPDYTFNNTNNNNDGRPLSSLKQKVDFDSDIAKNISTSSDLSNNNNNTQQQRQSLQTATWTDSLPNFLGIRQIIQQSKYRWCLREAGMWGIATGTAMTMHRFRMRSRVSTSINFGFASLLTVFWGSSYFCIKRREHEEKVVQLMMRFNQFEHASEMPTINNDYINNNGDDDDDENPFVKPVKRTDSYTSYDEDNVFPGERQYVAELPQRKDWQPKLPPQDPSKIFKPVNPK